MRRPSIWSPTMCRQPSSEPEPVTPGSHHAERARARLSPLACRACPFPLPERFRCPQLPARTPQGNEVADAVRIRSKTQVSVHSRASALTTRPIAGRTVRPAASS